MQRLCEHCGEPFLTKPNEIKRGFGRFCGKRCAGIVTGGILRRTTWVTPEHTDALQVRSAGLINMRVRRGKLVRPDRCEVCGKQCKPDGHHEDYAKPHEVWWLCRSCHMKRHCGSLTLPPRTEAA